MNQAIIYYDVAAVAVMVIAMASVSVRRQAHARAYRSFLAMVVIVTFTSLAALCGELYDAYVYDLLAARNGGVASAAILAPRDFLHLAYYALRTLTTPGYFMFLAVMTDTLHRFTNSNLRRLVMWAPLAITLGIIITNPLHHGIYAFTGNGIEAVRGPYIWTIYLSAVYYSLLGIGLLLRWRKVLSPHKFGALLAMYPLNLVAVLLQLFNPYLRVEMFFTSIAIMLVSTLVMRPEDDIDSFTNTLNFQAFEEMARHAFATEKPLCLVFIDIANKDRLRELSGVNAFRDVVRAVSSQVGTYLRPGDELYYLRNGLFCISARSVDAVQSLAIAQQSSRDGRAAAESLPEKSMHVQLRTCIVRVPQDVTDLKTLQTFILRIAHLIPNPCVVTYEELSHQSAFMLEMNLARIVSRGITERLFEVYYQPIWCVADSCFRSAEALVRLRDPEFGFVSPALFIPEAEQSGAILDVGRITLENIGRFLGGVDFEATGLRYVEVNLSVDQCVQPTLTREVMDLLERNGIESTRINLEITETSSSYSQDAIDANVRALAAHGVTFSLDDYGSGYSNLTRMLALPFNLVKLDKSFVDAMDRPDVHAVLADTIATMKRIGKKVLVEGVETNEQLGQLVEMGVDYVQGYLFAQPMPEGELVAFLEEHNARGKDA